MHRARVALTLTAVLTAVGCGDVGSVSVQDGGPMVDGGGDGGTPASTLRLEFVSDPSLPGGDAGGEFDATISTVQFALANVRAIGDGTPDDSRTTVSSVTFQWVGGDPEVVVFEDAPPGLYSLLRGSVVSMTVEGTVDVGGEVGPYRIEDDEPTAFTRHLGGVELAIGADVTAVITIEIDEIAADVPWDTVTPDGDGVRIVDSDSDLIDDVRDDLEDAFDGPTPATGAAL